MRHAFTMELAIAALTLLNGVEPDVDPEPEEPGEGATDAEIEAWETAMNRYHRRQENEDLEYSLREGYSGRGMYGTKCVGIETRGRENGLKIGAAIFAAWLMKHLEDGTLEEPSDVQDAWDAFTNEDPIPGSSDSMGLGQIFY